MIVEAAAILLLCEGVSNTPGMNSSNTTITDGFNSAHARTTSAYRARSEDQMRVRIQGDVVEVLPPESMTPGIRGAGREGWRTLSDLRMTDRQIEGQFAFNWTLRPLVKIDRMTGDIELRSRNLVSGLWSYRGSCRPYEQPTAPLF